MNLRVSAAFVALIAASAGAGCSGSSSESELPVPPADAYTVSYRNHVRLPGNGAVLSADAFTSQLRTRDPIADARCASDGSPAFRDISTFLGGIAWSHPVAIIKDASFPALYDGIFTPADPRASASEGAAASDAAPNIERPDLVGVQNGIAVFLSSMHGLIAVDARTGAPIPSCSMKLPGDPKNFLFHGNELVVVVNARGGANRSALLRYSFEGGTFRFVDAVRLDGQTIVDARLFDSTIVAYTSWSKPQPLVDAVVTGPVAAGGMGGGASAGAAAPSMAQRGPSFDHLGAKVIVVNWDAQLNVDWEDALLDDPTKQDPTEGLPPTTYTPGQLVYESKTYQSFVAASDRYVVVPRAVQQTRFSHYETYSYQVCTSYNPQFEQVESCHVNYERRNNPDYRAPDPATGDYSCNGKKLADCIQAAAPTVSQYIYAPVGQTCEKVWRGRCEAYETRTETYPRFDTQSATEMTVYRFEAGSFTKLDSSLATLVEKNNAIAFEKSPLSVKGSVANRNQLQFQNGHLYVFADQALQTLAVAGGSISYLNRLGIASSTSSNPSIAFSSDRAMISAASGYNGTFQTSQVTMLDLTTPSKPAQLSTFSMPGQSTQLILTGGGILGPGQVSFSNQQVQRSLEKLTLFSKASGEELDNLLLGTEYDAFETSWFAQGDDQRIRLGADGQRLFLPYSGNHHADQLAPAAHRLNITRIDGGRLVSERSFEVSDEIVRTAPIDTDRSLVFGNSATYLVDHTSGDWALSTLRELFVPFATYRLNDADLHARISRVGSKCRVTTHAGDAAIFGQAHLAQLDVPCNEWEQPVGFGSNIIFTRTLTGVRISPDGTTVEALDPFEAAALVKKIPSNRYCYVVSGSQPASGSQIEYLDAVPAKIACVALDSSTGSR